MNDVVLPKFRLSLLARFGLTGPEGPVELPNKKLAGLLAYLACTAPLPQPRQKLATLLWGSHFEAQAQQNLRQALFRLRRALGPDPLMSDGDEVWLAPGVIDCDVTRLKALSGDGSRASLAAAADLYQDSLLADVTIAEEAWADWLGAERPRLEGLALDAMIRYAEQALQSGNAESALKAANRAISVNALREDAHRLIVQALAATGRKAEALKHYQDLVVMLKRELNTEPDAATRSLVAELRTTQPLSGSHAVKTTKPALPAESGDAAPSEVAVGLGRSERRQVTIMACNIIDSMALSAHLEARHYIFDRRAIPQPHRLVGRMFDCRALAVIEVKGSPSMEAWLVRGEIAGVSRFEARRSGALSPFVGRQEEIELLLRRWDQAKRGEGRVVLLSGEPGIGKSRIAESLLAKLEGEPQARLRYFCSPHHAHSPLYPVIAQLERAASFEPSSGAGAKLGRLEALLKPTSRNVPRALALIADLLSVPTDGRYPALAVSPQQKREMTLTALLDRLDSAAAQGSVLIVVEDLHWIDPTSQDLLDRMVARVANLPVLLVVTVRPELQPTWVDQPHVSMLPLSRLGLRDSAAIINGVSKNKALPDAVIKQVLARADGVPLFVEELTSTLLESGLLREMPDRYVVEGPLPALAMPTTLQTSLVARLDGLGSVKDVAQVGAAIGREFSHELIAAVSALAVTELDAALERLTASGLISQRGTPPNATYSFKHALVQDAAYVTMLKSRRRQLHSSIATVLVERFPAMTENLPEVVAHHFTEARLASEAIGYWLKAARLASARWANREAVASFEQALHLLEAQPQTRETLERAIDIRFELRTSLLPLGEFERIFSHLHEAEGLARSLHDQPRLGQVSVLMCHNLWMKGQPKEALTFGQNAQTIAESLGDVPLQVMGNLQLGAACMWVADYPRAEDRLLYVLKLLEGDLGGNRSGLAASAAVAVRGYLTVVFAGQGKFEEALTHGQEGVRLAESLHLSYDLSSVYMCLAGIEIARGDLSCAILLLERERPSNREWNPILSDNYTARQGYAYALSGRTAEGIPLLEQALRASETMGYGLMQPAFLMYLGEAYVFADRLDEALSLTKRALTLARKHGRRGDETRALCLLGEVNARHDPPDHAEGHYREALALAEELGMRPLVAHCHLGLGKLYRRTGTFELAQEHLGMATTLYRQMDMRFWLEQAEVEASS